MFRPGDRGSVPHSLLFSDVGGALYLAASGPDSNRLCISARRSASLSVIGVTHCVVRRLSMPFIFLEIWDLEKKCHGQVCRAAEW